MLFFYPKDETPGCTKEACAFRDVYAEFKAADIEVFGISVDNVASHQAFKQKQNLNFTLLADETKEVCKKYGVLGALGFAQRVTFLIGKGGVIKKIFRDVQPEVHAKEVLEVAKTI
ncbi:MAG: peroxiredoxin [Chloroherpetonaceae bacterium]|nr:peroxiredoxin [Chloroherpetonaceae bacterium]